MFTRRTATVIISVPEASCACTITAGDGYLPVPTKRRDENVLPAMIRRSRVFPICPSTQPSSPLLTASDKVHDFDRVALPDRRGAEGFAFQHHQVVLDGNASRINA